MASKQFKQFYEPSIAELAAAKTIAGPFEQFDGSIIFEYLEPPPQLNATVLIRGTWINPQVKKINTIGRKHPQSPPLHIHFDQWESHRVATGKLYTMEGYDCVDKLLVPGGGVHHIPPYMPHTFYPCADAQEDAVLYLWAHPEGVPDPMDRLFFQTLLGFLSDVHEQKAPMSILQIMVTQHASATAVILFPKAWWLGPLRWWVPWQLQSGLAAVGRLMGYRGLIQRHTTPEEWADYMHAKRA